MPRTAPLATAFALAVASSVTFDAKPVSADNKPAPAAAPACKVVGGGKCCDPAIAAHLPKEAIYGACGESEATYEGENASSKDTCRYYFKGADGKLLETYVEVYAPKQDKPPASPSDPFFQWKRAGKAYYSEKALSPKMAAAALTKTGVYYAGKDYIVMVSAMHTVCTKEEAKKLATKIK